MLHGKYDSEGRTVVIQHEVRGGLYSAAVSLTTGTATSLIAADADYFTDIVEVTFANNSTAAAQVLLRNDGTTIRTIEVPAGSTVQLDFETGLKQNTRNTPWLADLEDITGSQVDVGAIFIKRRQ
jgi:hypothetical protein